MKKTLDSLVIAFASNVFLVLGGPYNTTLFGGLRSFHVQNKLGLCNGRITNS